MAKTSKTTVKTVTEEARARLQLWVEADGGNCAAANDDLKFAAGDQWPAEIKMQRMLDRRPCLTINKTDTFVRSVVNNMRQQRPRIKVHPVADGADEQVSDVIEGLIRHIEVSSNADSAYDTAADYQVRMGWGFVRVLAQYCDETSWDQDLIIGRVRNPFSVKFDPSSIQPDGLDATWALIIEPMKKTEYEALYPGKIVSDFSGPGMDDLAGSAKKDEVLVAEYFRIQETPAKLLRLSDGRSLFEGDPQLGDAKKFGDSVRDTQVMVIDERQSMKRQVEWYKLSGASEPLEERKLPGKYIPVLPVYGAELLEAGKVIRYGMVRNLKDPQKMYNFWRTSETEFVALAPKAPWLMAEGQDEGHEDEWNAANVKNYSSLKYVPVTGPDGATLPPPQRQQPQAVPAASVNAAMAASEDLKAVAGMFDPALGAAGQETSGSMVAKRQQQSDLSNFHFYDNLTRTIRGVGIVLLDLIPYYYDTERTIRIIGEDGNPKSTQINAPQQPGEQQEPSAQMQAVQKVLNDLTVGKYDVVMDTGPGYDTKREAGAENMMKLLSFLPEIGKVAGDMIVRQMDWPGANDLADRLAMANPLAKITDDLPDDMDPKAKQALAQAMGQIQTLQQEIQKLTQEKEAKVFGVQEREQAVTQRELQLTHLREEAETHRLHVREVGEDERAHLKAHTELTNTGMKNDTSLHETLIDATTNLQIAHKQALQKGVPNANNASTT